MSKILIDSEVLKRVIEALDYGYENLADNGCIFANDLDLAMHDLKKAIKESNGKHYSVLEWHGMDEVPNKFNWVITKDMNGFVSSDYVVYGDNNDWHLERTEKSCLTAWAYLPE